MNKHLNTLETPCVVVNHEKLVQNIRRVRDLAAAAGVRVRPHVKTHKCLEIARLQVDHGAVGLTASKVDEAIVFLEGGFNSITVAYPLVVGAKLDRLLAAACRRGAQVNVVADGEECVQEVSAAARRHGTVVRVLLKIDVGLHRCGIREQDPRLPALAHRIADDPQLEFHGLLSHAGHAYGASGMASIRAIAEEERLTMGRIRAKLEAAGLTVSEVSVGSTPTVIAASNFDGLTEVRPGNYVFMDQTQIRLGMATPDQVALSVLTTVVSANSEYLIVDAGSKVLSSDVGAHGTGGLSGYGVALPVGGVRDQPDMIVTKLSEEHGFVHHGGQTCRVGERLRIIPNHACPVVNLAERLVVLRGYSNPEVWRVDARGCVR